MKPKLREDVHTDLRGLINSAINQAMIGELAHPFKNCLNCMQFNEKAELCKLANSRPPARVIAYGCPKHEDMYAVPF